MKDHCQLKECLGKTVTYYCAKGVIQINRADYVKQVLKRFGMESCKPVGTSMVLKLKLEQNTNRENFQEYQ